MKTKIISLLFVLGIFTIFIACDDDSTNPQFTPQCTCNIQGREDMTFESNISALNTETIQNQTTTTFSSSFTDNNTLYVMAFKINDVAKVQKYDLTTEFSNVSFTVFSIPQRKYNNIISGELNLEQATSSMWKGKFGFNATDSTLKDTIFVSYGNIDFDMED